MIGLAVKIFGRLELSPLNKGHFERPKSSTFHPIKLFRRCFTTEVKFLVHCQTKKGDKISDVIIFSCCSSNFYCGALKLPPFFLLYPVLTSLSFFRGVIETMLDIENSRKRQKADKDKSTVAGFIELDQKKDHLLWDPPPLEDKYLRFCWRNHQSLVTIYCDLSDYHHGTQFTRRGRLHHIQNKILVSFPLD
jgi:hypothetical protein